MKIGIDARHYGTGHAGIGRYTAELIKNLEKITPNSPDGSDQYIVFLQRDNFEEYQPINPNFQKVLANFKLYSWQEQLLFPRLLNKYNLDLVHFTHFNAPLFYRRKFIVTIHDLIVTHFPTSRATMLNPLMYAVKLFFYNLIVKSAAKRSIKTITVSEFSKQDIVKMLGINSDKIVVTHEGVDLPKLQEADCEKTKNDLGIAGDFLLYVGAAYPHKNLEKLISAFDLINKEKPNLQLVLVGKNGYFYQRLREFAQASVSQEAMAKIIFTGYLDDYKLSCLYKTAKLYVFPSLLEGFGLPPLEAQANNLPVASSDKSCMPEVLGEGAIYFDPENIEDMKNKIIQVLSDDNLSRELIQKGLSNLERFSWRKCASQVLELYFSQK